MNEVVVTGMGVVSPLGNDLDTFRRQLFAGASGIRDIRGDLVPEDFPVPYAGVAPKKLSYTESDRQPSAPSDAVRFAVDATLQALADLPEGTPCDAIVYGTAEGLNFEVVQESFRRDMSRTWEQTLAEGSAEAIAQLLSRHRWGEIPNRGRIALSSACASGNQALGIAFHRIRQGLWQRALVGGVDARLKMMNLLSFHMLGALATEPCPAEKASRPFSSDRMGFVRSEGAASLLLEERDAAEERGAEILARVTGYAHTNDAHHFTEGRQDGAAVVAAMAGALRDADVGLSDVDVISAHGTATRMNDRLESAAIKKLFGSQAYLTPVTALKSQLGHCTVAAGAIEAVAGILMLREQRIAPTINYREDEIDPACDLDYVPNQTREARLRRVLSNSLGFGGHNTALLLEAA